MLQKIVFSSYSLSLVVVTFLRAKVHYYLETRKKIGEKFYKKLSGSIRGGWYHILARIRTEIQSHTFPRCATSPAAQLYEPSVSSPILPFWEKSSL
jgi:hypothetical protein